MSDEELRELEGKLRSAETRFRALVENSVDAFIILDEQGRLAFATAGVERLLGYPLAERMGRNLEDITHPEDGARIMGGFAEMMRTGLPSSIEFRVRRADGEWIVIETVAKNRLADPDVRGIVATFRDVTERKRAEEALRSTEAQLRQMQKLEAIGSLAAGIAHDFNNLLSVILSYTDLLLERLRPDDGMRAYIQEVHGAGARATELTRQLLAFSRQQVLQPRVLDLNELVRGIERMLGRIVGAHVKLTIVPSPTPVKVNADPNQLEQVLLNLVANATDAMPDGGTLTIEIGGAELDEAYARTHVNVTPGHYVCLRVTDTGLGMDRATQERMFEPFFTTKSLGRGTGLGLAMVFGIVQQSRGHIHVYSELGKGTTVKLYLPRSDAPADQTETHAESTVVGGTETILLVDDDDHVRGATRDVLIRYGYDVLDAANAGEALLIAEQHASPIHLLLTDVVMPRMGGRALAERLAALEPSMKVLYMSGYTNHSITHQGVLDANIALLEKPITAVALARKVREVLDK